MRNPKDEPIAGDVKLFERSGNALVFGRDITHPDIWSLPSRNGAEYFTAEQWLAREQYEAQ